jgi:hypothetical protein
VRRWRLGLAWPDGPTANGHEGEAESNGHDGGPVGFARPALAVRVRAVAEADRRGELDVLAGELDLLVEAATEWAALARAQAAARLRVRRDAGQPVSVLTGTRRSL